MGVDSLKFLPFKFLSAENLSWNIHSEENQTRFISKSLTPLNPLFELAPNKKGKTSVLHLTETSSEPLFFLIFIYFIFYFSVAGNFLMELTQSETQ